MRTTVTIDDRLLAQAKQAAASSGRTLGDLVDDGLRLLLTPAGRRGTTPVTLPVFGGSGLRPGVDLDDKEGLAARDGASSSRAAG
jgi:hypothetical protein